MRATWRRIDDLKAAQRSSHVIAATDGNVYVFGGEYKPRQPVDNQVLRIPFHNRIVSEDRALFVEAASAPSPRVGSASAVLGKNIYLFSGRGGEAMAPIEEDGALRVFDLEKEKWMVLNPHDPAAPFPPARSYHAMTSDKVNTIFVHAGCPESGRLSDLWAFSTSERIWTQLADAPEPRRGGTSVAYLNGKLYRMNGFDGKHEQGFALNVYDCQKNSWTTKTWDVKTGPSPRSVSTVQIVKVNGKDFLITMFGESDPSNAGHQGAGKMLDDVWAYDLGEEIWQRVHTKGEKPIARGWFAADVVGQNQVLIHGGLAEDNTRIGDAWSLTF